MQFPNAIGQYRKPSGGVAIPPVVVVPAPVFTTQPAVSPTSGTTATTFTASNGVASNATTYTRRWLLNGTLIGTGTTVSPSSTGSLTLEVTATGPGGVSIATTNPITVTSAAVPAPSFTTQPSISPSSGDTNTTFTANTGTASNASSYTIRWLLNGNQVAGNVTTYTSAAGSLTIEVTATNSSGSAVATSSAVNVTSVVVTSNPGPQLTAQSDPTSYPPAPNMATTAYQLVGDNLRVQAASSYSDLLAGSNLVVNDATFVLTNNVTTNQNGLRSKLAGITSGTTFFRVRSEGSATSAWSNVIQHGTAAVPTVTAGLNANVNSAFQLSNTITLSGPVASIAETGEDMGRFEIVNANVAASSFVERWLNNGSQTYGTGSGGNGINPGDFNGDNVYTRAFIITGLNGQTATSASGGVTVLDYDTTADQFTFTDLTNREPSTQYESNTVTIGGMATGYVGNNGTCDGEYSKNGAAYSTVTPFSYTNGDTFKLRKTTPAGFSPAATSVTLTLGTVSDTWNLGNKVNPANISPTFQDYTNSSNNGLTSAQPVVLKAGVNVLRATCTGGVPTSLSVPGATSVSRKVRSGPADQTTPGFDQSMWEVVMPSDSSTTATFTSGGASLGDVYVSATALSNAKAGAINLFSLPKGYNDSYGNSLGATVQLGPSTGAGAPIQATTVADGNIALVLILSFSGAATWNVGTVSKQPGGISDAYLTATGVPTFTRASGGEAMGIIAVWEKA